MKPMIKLFSTTLFSLLLAFTCHAQLFYQMDVYNQSWGPMPGVQPFLINIIPADSTQTPLSFAFSTDANGQFFDSLVGVPTSGLLVSHLMDCTGSVVTRTTPYALAPAGSFVLDTFQISCASPSTSATSMLVSGVVYDQGNPSSPVPGTLVDVYVNQSNGAVSYAPLWTDSLGRYNYSAALLGTHGVVSVKAHDCQGNLFSSNYPYYTAAFVPTAVDSFNIVCGTATAPPPPTPCQADFILDSINSFNGQVVIWNTSFIPTWATSFSYQWDFGDGNFSTSPFPSHQYAAAGTYNLCLTLTASDTGFSCTSTYCDTIGMDVNGNLIYKGQSTGFQLLVLDPNSIGLEETLLDQVVAYPNPASGYIKLEVPSNHAFGYQLLDLSGRTLVNGKITSATSIDLSSLSNGMYFLQVQNGQAMRTLKIQVAN